MNDGWPDTPAQQPDDNRIRIDPFAPILEDSWGSALRPEPPGDTGILNADGLLDLSRQQALSLHQRLGDALRAKRISQGSR